MNLLSVKVDQLDFLLPLEEVNNSSRIAISARRDNDTLQCLTVFLSVGSFVECHLLFFFNVKT